MRKFCALAVFFFFPALVLIADGQQAPQRAHVVILSTTDMHGRISDRLLHNSTQRRDREGGTLVRTRARITDLLLIDSAHIQGRRANTFIPAGIQPPDPMCVTMSA